MPRRSYHVVPPETRQRVWDLYSDPAGQKSLAAIGRELRLSKSTVFNIIESFRRLEAGVQKKPAGRPSKLTKRYVFLPKSDVLHALSPFRWRQRLINLAKKHPFWGAKRLSEDMYHSMMAMYQSMPEGHVFQVF